MRVWAHTRLDVGCCGPARGCPLRCCMAGEHGQQGARRAKREQRPRNGPPVRGGVACRGFKSAAADCSKCSTPAAIHSNFSIATAPTPTLSPAAVMMAKHATHTLGRPTPWTTLPYPT